MTRHDQVAAALRRQAARFRRGVKVEPSIAGVRLKHKNCTVLVGWPAGGKTNVLTTYRDWWAVPSEVREFSDESRAISHAMESLKRCSAGEAPARRRLSYRP